MRDNHKGFGIREKVLATSIGLIFVILAFVPAASANTGGPDAYGYQWMDTKNPPPTTTYSWIDITTTGTLSGITGDDSQGILNIGFSSRSTGVPIVFALTSGTTTRRR